MHKGMEWKQRKEIKAEKSFRRTKEEGEKLNLWKWSCESLINCSPQRNEQLN